MAWNRRCIGRGIEVGEEEPRSLLFAYDKVIFAKTKEDMEYMIEALEEEFGNKGMKIYFNKTEYMCIGEEQNDIQTIKHCDTFKYLGSIITRNGIAEGDINNKIRSGEIA